MAENYKYFKVMFYRSRSKGWFLVKVTTGSEVYLKTYKSKRLVLK